MSLIMKNNKIKLDIYYWLINAGYKEEEALKINELIIEKKIPYEMRFSII